MQKDGSIIISDWQNGTSLGTLSYAESVVNCDIYSEPGVLKINSDVAKTSNSINNFNTGTDEGVGLTVAMIKDQDAYNPEHWLTNIGYLANNDGVLASPLGKGWDMVAWGTSYILVSYANGGTGYIGVLERTGTSSIWYAAKVGGLTGLYAIKLLLGQDGYVYYTNGNTIGKITNVTGTGAGITVTSTSNALNLPRDVYATTLVELGSDLLIGTQKGADWSARNTYNFANIYKWDRTSASFRLPVQINEAGINAMIQKDNQVYLSAGVMGNIYVTDGTNYQKIKTIPYTKVNKFGATCTVYYNSMAFNQDGNLLIGTSTLSDVTPNIYTKHGVWEIAIKSGYPISLAYTTLSGETGKNYAVSIGHVFTNSSTQKISFGSRIETTTRTNDVLDTLVTFRDNYLAFYESQIFLVGSRQGRKTYQTIEFTLLEPLVSGQSLKLSYRKNGEVTYTEIGEWSYSTIGSQISHFDSALIADAEFVQLKIQLKQLSSTIYPGNIKLLRVIIK